MAFFGQLPGFALGAAMAALRWLREGWGYEVTGADVVEAYDRAMAAAKRLNEVDSTTDRIRQLLEANDSEAVAFVRWPATCPDPTYRSLSENRLIDYGRA